MNRCISAALFAALTLASANALAFDKARKGLLIGLGGGVHNSAIEVNDQSDLFRRDFTELGGAASFRVGGGLTNNITLYFANQMNFDSDAAYGLSGFGATYYFRNSTPSWYLHGGIGVGVVVFEDEDRESAGGEAILFGVGLEPISGLHLDLSIMNVTAEDTTTYIFDDIEYDIFSTQFMVGYTWF